MFNLFKKKPKVTSVAPLTTDIHSHLLPELDDGVNSVEESLEILKEMQQLGYQKVITTPHIMSEVYPNTSGQIREQLEVMRQAIEEEGLAIELEAAAEYYLDEGFMELLKTPGELLTFGGKYLLFEMPFMNKPVFWKQAVYQIRQLGLQPVLAHPERYIFLQQDPSLVDELLEQQVLLQLNLNSLAGKYSKEARKCAEMLVERQVISFAGSDCHHIQHLLTLRQALQKSAYSKLTQQKLLNNEV